MTEITIFDSRGYRLGEPDGSRDDEIKQMNKYGVVCSVAKSQPPKLTVYFRARESSSGRLEQYYARYVPDRRIDIGFADEIKEYAEANHGLSVADSTGGENFLGTLLARPNLEREVGMIRDRNRAQELLKQGQRLRFGSGSYEDAFSLVLNLVGSRPGLKAAITEDQSTLGGGMSGYDLVVEKGHYSGMTPLGDTKEKMRPPEPAAGSYGGSAGSSGPLEEFKQNPGKLVALLVVVVSSALLLSILGSFILWTAAGVATPVTDYIPGQTSIEFDDGESPILQVSSPLQNGKLVYLRNGQTMLTKNKSIGDKDRNVSVLPAPYGATKVRFSVSGPVGTETATYEFNSSTDFESLSVAQQSVLAPSIDRQTATVTEGQVVINGTGTGVEGVRVWVDPTGANASDGDDRFKTGNMTSGIDGDYLRLDTTTGTFAYAETLDPGTYNVKVALIASDTEIVYETAQVTVESAPPEPQSPFERLRIDGTDALTASEPIHINGTQNGAPLTIDATVRNTSHAGVRVVVRNDNDTVISRTTLKRPNTTKNTSQVTATYNLSTGLLDYELQSLANGSYEVWVAPVTEAGAGVDRVETNVTIGPPPAPAESTETPTPSPSSTSTEAQTASQMPGNTTDLSARPAG